MLRSLSLFAALLILLTGCSRGPDPLDSAERALARGDLDRAELLLGDLEGPSVEPLQARIHNLRQQRARARERMGEIEAMIPGLPLGVAQRQLRELLPGGTDPILREEIEVFLSGLRELYVRRRATTASAVPASAGPGGAGGRPLPRWDPYDRSRRETIDAPARPPAPARPAPPLAPAGADVAPPATSAVPWSRSPRDLARSAFQHLGRGELAEARDAYLEAAGLATVRAERSEYAGRAREAEDRRILRAEVAQAFRDDPAPFEQAGFGRVEERGLVRGGVEIAWSDLRLSELGPLAKPARLSLRARLGLIHERLVRRSVVETWGTLADLVEEGLVEPGEAAGIVARSRGEQVPPGGYAFHGGDWIPRAEMDRIERAGRLDALGRALLEAEGPRRDELVGAFLAEGAQVELLVVLEARWRRSAGELAGNRCFKRLSRLAERRAELDRRRGEALELIFDEERYFHPHTPPECPPERARLYPAVQREVDELVARVREVWREGTEVEVSATFREGVSQIEWNLARQRELGASFPWPDELPPWVIGVETRLERVGLGELAWSAEERADLAYSRAVRARNRELWDRRDPPAGGDGADRAERRQVEITNDYRMMLGRRALAWNPRIQAAAQDHSDYMSRTGDFGHVEGDPQRRTPGDRMRRRGYEQGVGENCHMGGGDPRGAHDGWTHSSGHHRNLLMEDHREMASALAAGYWTQDFGVGGDFQGELSKWQD